VLVYSIEESAQCIVAIEMASGIRRPELILGSRDHRRFHYGVGRIRIQGGQGNRMEGNRMLLLKFVTGL
jgi:hypothetical protein